MKFRCAAGNFRRVCFFRQSCFLSFKKKDHGTDVFCSWLLLLLWFYADPSSGGNSGNDGEGHDDQNGGIPVVDAPGIEQGNPVGKKRCATCCFDKRGIYFNCCGKLHHNRHRSCAVEGRYCSRCGAKDINDSAAIDSATSDSAASDGAASDSDASDSDGASDGEKSTTGSSSLDDDINQPVVYVPWQPFTRLEEEQVRMLFDNVTRYCSDTSLIVDQLKTGTGTGTGTYVECVEQNFGHQITYDVLDRFQSWRPNRTNPQNYLSSRLVTAYADILREKNMQACQKNSNNPSVYMCPANVIRLVIRESKNNNKSVRRASYSKIVHEHFRSEKTKKRGLKHILDADIILFPTNFNDIHWYLLDINIQQEQYNSYDSMYARGARTKYMHMLREFHFVMCEYFKNDENNETRLSELAAARQTSLLDWPCKECLNCPQQNNAYDCGAMVSQMMHHIALSGACPANTPRQWQFGQADIDFLKCRMALEINARCTRHNWMLEFQHGFKDVSFVALDTQANDQYVGQMYRCVDTNVLYRVGYYNTNLSTFVLKRSLRTINANDVPTTNDVPTINDDVKEEGNGKGAMYTWMYDGSNYTLPPDNEPDGEKREMTGVRGTKVVMGRGAFDEGPSIVYTLIGRHVTYNTATSSSSSHMLGSTPNVQLILEDPKGGTTRVKADHYKVLETATPSLPRQKQGRYTVPACYQYKWVDWFTDDRFQCTFKTKAEIVALIMGKKWVCCTPNVAGPPFVLPAVGVVPPYRRQKRVQKQIQERRGQLRQNYTKHGHRPFKPNNGQPSGQGDTMETFGANPMAVPSLLKMISRVKEGAGSHGLGDLVAADCKVRCCFVVNPSPLHDAKRVEWASLFQ